MNHSTLYILMIVGALLSACRTNNGDIGPLYGEWALRSLTVDGEEADVDCSQYYFRFQNNIICITTVKPFNDFTASFGTWEMREQRIWLNFTHRNQDENTTVFDPPAALMIPDGEITEMDINTLTTKALQMAQTDSLGAKIVYRLEKLQ